MAYTVRYRELDVKCDSLDEVDRLAERNKAQNSGRLASSISEVVTIMNERSQQLLKLLVEKQTPIAKSTWSKLAKLEEKQLPAYISGITKPLDAAGFKADQVLHKEKLNGGELHYSLVPGASEEVRKGLRMT